MGPPLIYLLDLPTNKDRSHELPGISLKNMNRKVFFSNSSNSLNAMLIDYRNGKPMSYVGLYTCFLDAPSQ